jgi:hypothetical protein
MWQWTMANTQHLPAVAGKQARRMSQWVWLRYGEVEEQWQANSPGACRSGGGQDMERWKGTDRRTVQSDVAVGVAKLRERWKSTDRQVEQSDVAVGWPRLRPA